MKRLVALFALLFSSSLLFAQVEFAPVGAEWYYSSEGLLTTGYEKMISEKDTVLNSKSCRKISRSTTFYYGPTYQIISQTLQPVFVCDSNGVYYFFQNDHFAVLYDFNKNPGEYWITDAYDFQGICGPIGKIYVDSVGFEEINNVTLKWMSVHNDSTITGFFGDYKKIYQRMGSSYYLLPVPACVIYEAGFGLRCYSDSVLQYQNSDCDSFYTGIGQLSIEGISIFPNPASDELIVYCPPNLNGSQIEIFDVTGRKVKTSIFSNSQNEISISDLPAGIYSLRMKNYATRFVKE